MNNVQTSQSTGAPNNSNTRLEERTRQFEQLMEDHAKVVYAGLWKVMKGQYDLAEDTLGAEVESLYFDTWLWVWENLEDLLTQGTASISTRLYAKAFWIARTWKTTRLRHRQRFVSYDEHVAALDAEQFRTRRVLNRACKALVEDARQDTVSDSIPESENILKQAA